jgi:phage baseplate assembly protein W
VSARYRGWRFVLPDLDVAGAPTGLQISQTGAVAMVEDDDAIRQALLLLVTTRPGERIMRPEYGCELHRLVFAPNDDTTAGLAIHYVRRAVERWEPRVEILGIDASRRRRNPAPGGPSGSEGDDEQRAREGTGPDEDGLLDVVLDYRVRATRRTGRLVIPIALYDEVGV